MVDYESDFVATVVHTLSRLRRNVGLLLVELPTAGHLLEIFFQVTVADYESDRTHDRGFGILAGLQQGGG